MSAEPTPQPEPTPTPTRGFARRLVVPAFAIAAIVLGMAGGVASRIATKAKAAPEEAGPVVERPAEPLPLGKRIDAAVLEGRYADALALCQAAPSPSEEPVPEWADREGLCLEGLGRWDEAAETYERATHGPSGATARARAELGLVRCRAVLGDLAAARDLLSQLVLRSAEPGVNFHMLADCLAHRAWLDVLALGPQSRPAPFDPDAVEWPSLRPAVNRHFEWQLAPRKLPAEHATANKAGVAREEIDLTLRLAEAPVIDLLRRVAAEAGLFLRVEPGAASRLAGKTGKAQVEGCPLTELLRALTEPHGLRWHVAGDTVTVSLARALERTPLLEATDRTLRTAARLAPDHPAATAVRVARANVAWLAGHTRDATAGYRRLLDEAPHTAESPAVAYNLGLAELRLGNPGAARNAFLDCIDRFDEGEETRLGWWWVGYSFLEAGEPEEALAPLRTATAAGSREVRSAAALVLCACDHLLGNEAESGARLRAQRTDSHPKHVALARLFEALHQYEVRPSGGRAGEAVRALEEVENGRFLGTAGVFLAGRAYARLGMLDKMADLYRTEAEKAKGQLALRMAFAVAERDRDLDRRTAARERYLVIAERDKRELGARAELRLAELASRDGHGSECVARCRALVGRAGVEPEEYLVLMGRGYELERMHLHAAECFAGRVPGE